MVGNWNRDKIETLIMEVQRYPWLWDSSRDDYRKIKKKLATWKAISLVIGKTAKDCQERWRTLRDTYKKIVNREKKSPNCSENSKKWYYMTHLEFLQKPEIKQIKINFVPQNISIEQPTEIEYIESSVEPEIVHDLSNCEEEIQILPQSLNNNNLDNTSDNNLIFEIDSSDDVGSLSDTKCKNFQNKTTQSTSQKNSFEKVLESPQRPVEAQTPNDDEDYHFGQIVAATLRRIPQPRRSRIRMDILKILYEGEFCTK